MEINQIFHLIFAIKFLKGDCFLIMLFKKILKLSNVLLFLLILAALEILLLVNQNRQFRQALIPYTKYRETLKKGELIKIVPLKTLAGNFINLEDYLKTKPHTFLLFFSSNCPACEKDIPIWKKIQQVSQNSEFSIIAVSLDNEIETKRFAYFNKLDFDILLDDDNNTFFKANKVHSVPELILINSEGIVENIWIGAISVREEKSLNDILNSLFNTESTAVPKN